MCVLLGMVLMYFAKRYRELDRDEILEKWIRKIPGSAGMGEHCPERRMKT